METKKKTILWLSDHSRLLTGFGRNSKAVLKYLFDSQKYNLVEYACAPFTFKDKRLESVPWTAYGAVPEDPYICESIQNGDDEMLKVSTRYGSYHIDELVEKHKPDVFIGVNDFWAFHGLYDKPWWNRVNCALWVTLDSLPIYPDAVQNAHKIKNFWVWSKFAQTEMNRLGFDQVKTLHGAFDVSNFKPLPNKQKLKEDHGVKDNFIIGFVFRNQIRKLVGTLLEGFAIHKENSPDSNVKLLLHTSWSEGWSIPDFIEEFKLNKEDILTTHVCMSCKKYEIRSFDGEGKDCRCCGTQKSLVTPTGGMGLTEDQMNEVYNLMDFYIHPITSGGLEMPLVESLLAGTPIATVNYSCGEEFCEQPFVTTIDHAEYREINTQFKKSQPYPEHIWDIIEWASSGEAKSHLEFLSKQGREWVLKEFDLNLICKKVEDWIDSCPEVDHDSYSIKPPVYNEDFVSDFSIKDDEEWAIDLVVGVFGYFESDKSDTVKRMVKNLKDGGTRQILYEKSIERARIHNDSKKKSAASNFFPDDDFVNNICFVAPHSLEDKLNVSHFFKALCEGEEKIYLIGEEPDRNLFSQYGKFTLIPKNSSTMKMEYLTNIKNQKGKKRFKTIMYKAENEIKVIEN